MKRKKPISEAERVMDRYAMLAEPPARTVLYVLEGECVARVYTTKNQPTIMPGTEIAVATVHHGEFGIWQLEDVLKRLKANYRAKTNVMIQQREKVVDPEGS